ncbi:MAG: hypothetical protein QOH92_3358 [Chloroflexota bacterium]|jgi:hypothetical protein|nr:hypothetical protein [Chloroflexota bacterium]
MNPLRSPRRILGAVAIVAALAWGSSMVASTLPQTERLRADVHSSRTVDYATDVVVPGSRFTTRPTYDQ